MGFVENMVFIICVLGTIALATRDDGDDRRFNTSTQNTGNWPERRSNNFVFQPVVREHQEFYNEMLNLHNEARTKHDAEHLNWNYSAIRSTMDHLESIIKGENKQTEISMFYNTYVSEETEQQTAKTIFDFWYNEREHYDYDHEPENTKAKHFTQIVWKATRSVGFAFAYKNRKNYFVAMYVPVGNFANAYRKNVGRPKPDDAPANDSTMLTDCN